MVLRNHISECVNLYKANENRYDIFENIRMVSLKTHRIGSLCHMLDNCISDIISNTSISMINSNDIAHGVPRLYGLRNRIHDNGFVNFNLVLKSNCPLTVGVRVGNIKQNGGWSNDPRSYEFYYDGLDGNSFIIIEDLIQQVDDVVSIIQECIRQLDEEYGIYRLEDKLEDMQAI